MKRSWLTGGLTVVLAVAAAKLLLHAAELSHPWTAAWENGPVLVCRQPRLPLAEMWSKLKNWD